MKSRQIDIRVQPSYQPGRWTHIIVRGRSMAQTFDRIARAFPYAEVRCAAGWRPISDGPVYTKR